MSASKVEASASSPTQPAMRVVMPKFARLAATLAAPPALSFCCFNKTTGTGASGEMRCTSPIK